MKRNSRESHEGAVVIGNVAAMDTSRIRHLLLMAAAAVDDPVVQGYDRHSF
jgi:hypothetical protein